MKTESDAGISIAYLLCLIPFVLFVPYYLGTGLYGLRGVVSHFFCTRLFLTSPIRGLVVFEQNVFSVLEGAFVGFCSPWLFGAMVILVAFVSLDRLKDELNKR